MKKIWLSSIFWAVCCIAYAQSLLDQPIRVNIENKTLEEALLHLVDSADVNLSFSNSILPESKKVTFYAYGIQLDKVLDNILAGTLLSYRETSTSIIIYEKSEEELESFTISGFVKDAESGELVIGAVVFDPERKVGTYTNQFGFYSISVKEGNVNLMVSNLGYEPTSISFFHSSNIQLSFELKPFSFEPILVKSFSDSDLVEVDVFDFEFNMAQVSKMASLGGENDLIRIATTVPGIQTGADGFGGLSVRGGGIDQNLFLLDGVPIYNAMHGIGLFSIYNSSAIKSVKILKGSFPARYGGRMSSVWDIHTKEGNRKSFLGEVDIGVTSGKLTLEGPLKKEKGSFFFSGRRSLFDFYAEPISRKLRDNGGFVTYNFDDINIKLNYDFSGKDKVFLSYYGGNDNYYDLRRLMQSFGDTLTTFSDREIVSWGNNVAALRWNHLLSNEVFMNTTFTYSLYEYQSQDFVDLIGLNAEDTLTRDVLLQLYSSVIKDYSIKTDIDVVAYDRHKVKLGGQITWHEFSAKIASFENASEIDFVIADTIGDSRNAPLRSTEIEGYIEDDIHIGENLFANIGLRISSSKVLDNWFVLPQPRMQFTFSPSNKSAVSFSINRVTQFLHLLSPSRLGLPKDLWVTATEDAPPQKSWQFVLSSNQKLFDGFHLNLDLYYKRMSNLPLFTGASLTGVNTLDWQKNIEIGKGKSYGFELLLQRQHEKWGGWLSYTLGWSDRKFSKEINDGESFPIKLDRRHNLNIQLVYDLNENWDLACGYTIASGSFYSLPSQEYSVILVSGVPIAIEPLIVPEGVNDQMLPTYHRLDFSASYSLDRPKSKQTVRLGVTNLYNRLNPLFRTLRDKFEDDGVLSSEFVEVSLLPIFPSLRYIVELK